MKTQIVIMAAGIGQRFGEGIKQLTPLGPNGELIIDYSIEFAKEAGFDEVIFVIRKDIEKEFDEKIGNRIKNKINCKYAFQELDMLPDGFKKPDERIKPYGTGHCILCAKHLIDSPFVVINADDYYGKSGFQKIHNFLISNQKNKNSNILNMCMAGFIIGNTLSDNGTVTRGICKKDENDFLISVNETYDIKKDEDNCIYGRTEQDDIIKIADNTLVSMNMWGLPVEFINELDNKFIDFLNKNNDNIKSEFLLPEVIDKLLQEKKGIVKVLQVSDKWYGITYASDKNIVIEALKNIGSIIK